MITPHINVHFLIISFTFQHCPTFWYVWEKFLRQKTKMIFDAIGSYFPNVIGAIDDCHLEIELHGEDPYTYYNYLWFHSIHLLVVSLADLSFSYINVGFLGKWVNFSIYFHWCLQLHISVFYDLYSTFRAHDSLVFWSSDLGLNLSQLMLVPSTDVDSPSVIAANTFPFLKQVVTAFQHNKRGITRSQMIFIRHLSSKRQVNIIAFTLLLLLPKEHISSSTFLSGYGMIIQTTSGEMS